MTAYEQTTRQRPPAPGRPRLRAVPAQSATTAEAVTAEQLETAVGGYQERPLPPGDLKLAALPAAPTSREDGEADAAPEASVVEVPVAPDPEVADPEAADQVLDPAATEPNPAGPVGDRSGSSAEDVVTAETGEQATVEEVDGQEASTTTADEPALTGLRYRWAVLVAWLRATWARAIGVAKARAREPEAWKRLGRMFVPPKLITEQRPSLQQQAYYAWYGPQVPAHGPLRFLSRVWGVLVSLPTSWMAYSGEWVFERFTRFVGAYLLYVLVMQIPYVGTIVEFVWRLATWFITVWFPN